MSDFNARWISNKEFYDLAEQNVFHKETNKVEIPHPEHLKNKHILFRNHFTITDLSKDTRATVKISADDYYKLYINGRFVTQGPAPGYSFHYYYNEIDITEYLISGENTVAVHTYYQGLVNRVWVSADFRHGLAFLLSVDGENVLQSDESWKCAYHTGFTACGIIGYQTQFAERYDASAPEIGFENVDFDDSKWEKAYFVTKNEYKMYPQPTKQLCIYDIKPKILKKTSYGYFIDFGIEAVGYLSLTASGKGGDTLILRFGEELEEDGSVRYKMRCCCEYSEEFILSGKECDKLSQYDYKAFRYVDIIVPESTSIDEDSIEFTVRHYPFTQKKKYNSDDVTLNEILKLCSDTIKYGVQECFMDCPHREKGQYLGDVTISGIAHMVLTGDASMIRKALENYCQSSFICKGLMTVAPSSFMQEIADYSLQFPFQVLYVYKYTGDLEFLKEMYPYVMNVCEFFSKYRRENGLIEGVKDKWNLVDWPMDLRDNYDFELPTIIGDGYHNVINAFYLAMLKHINEIREILGKERLPQEDETYRGYVDMFYDPEQKLFVDSEGSTHASYQSNAVALFAKCFVDEENKAAMVKHIEKKTLCSGGTYMAFFALYGLKQIGETELVKTLIKDENAWLNMLKNNATVCHEVWDKSQKWNASFFHPWSSAPIIVLD